MGEWLTVSLAITLFFFFLAWIEIEPFTEWIEALIRKLWRTK